MPSRMAAGLLVAALVPALAVPVAAQQATAPSQAGVTGAVQVTRNADPGRAHSSPQIAVHPRTGELVIAETEVRTAKTCNVHVSVDEGRSWFPGGDPMKEPFTDCSGDPINGPYFTLAFDPDGVLYLAFVANDPRFNDRNRSERPRHVFLARSTDSGRSFETSLVYEAPEDVTDDGRVGNRRPMVAVDPSDPARVYVGWLQRGAEGEPPKALVAASSDSGKTFAEPVDLAGDSGGYQPRPVVGRDGTVHAIIPSSGFDPDRSPFEVQRGLYYRRSTDHGATWSDPVEVDPGNIGFYAGRKWLLAIDGDTLYAVWYGHPDPDFDPLTQDTDVFLRTSTDGGQTWGDRMQVNDEPDTGIELANAYSPGIAVAPNGRVDVAWYDFRNSPYPERFPEGFAAPFNHDGYQDVYYSSSSDRGATFSPDVRVTDRIINREIGVWSNNVHSHYNVGIASTDDTVYLAWQDTRNGDREHQSEDIYFASVRLADPVRPAAALSGASLWSLLAATLLLGMGLAMTVGWGVTRRARRVGRS